MKIGRKFAQWKSVQLLIRLYIVASWSKRKHLLRNLISRSGWSIQNSSGELKFNRITIYREQPANVLFKAIILLR